MTDSNFKKWQHQTGDIKEQLALFVDNVAKGADDKAIVYEIALRLGLPLTTDISHKDGAYWLLNGGGYYALIIQPLRDFNAVINQNPIKIVALDRAFANDVQKSNAVLQCQDADIELVTI